MNEYEFIEFINYDKINNKLLIKIIIIIMNLLY